MYETANYDETAKYCSRSTNNINNKILTCHSDKFPPMSSSRLIVLLVIAN